MKVTKTESRVKIGLFFLWLMCILITSCSNEVSKSERKVKNNNGKITVSGNDDGREFECSGFDLNFTSDTSVYSCNGNELVINR